MHCRFQLGTLGDKFKVDAVLAYAFIANHSPHRWSQPFYNF